MLRWILKILHDPEDLIPWELWYYSILGSCRIFSINRRFRAEGKRSRIWDARLVGLLGLWLRGGSA